MAAFWEMKLTPVAFVLAIALTSASVGGDLAGVNLRAAAEYSAARRGSALLVIQHGRTIFEDYPNGHSAGEPHKIYSGTKAFWNLAALAAVEEGLFSLDDRVAETITEWRGDAGRSRITIRQLLDFTSGLDAENHLHSTDVANRADIALRVPQVAAAGEAFIYGPCSLQVFHELLRRKLAPRRDSPVHFLEQKVLRPLGFGPQNYRPDHTGNPLLASGFLLTARQWSRMGTLVLHDGPPVVSPRSFAQCLRGSAANRAFALGFWNNRLGNEPGAREFDIEDMLERKWQAQDWRRTCLCRDAPADLVASVGSGYQRLLVIPSLALIVVRQGEDAKFSDGRFLRLLLGR
jgi:CubicO group peptidase (beta-lactamase class C family)